MALPPQLIDSNTQLTNQKVINSVQYTGYYANLTGVEEGEIHVELNKLISNHTVLSYTETWNHLKEIDRSIDDATKIDLFYTGRSHPNTDSDWEQNPIRSNNSWNREHIWPRSHGGFDPEKKSNVAGTDLHNLRPTDKSVNSARGNKDFGYATTQHEECTECNFSYNYWEPPNSIKGDIARTLFYMDVRYEGILNEPELSLFDGYTQTSVGSGRLGKLCTIYQWNVDDPVDTRELERNNAIFEIQNNKNPFIDFPQFAIDIWGEQCDTDFDDDGLWNLEDLDDDNDGVNDLDDLCLTTSPNMPVNTQGCALNELDSDNDGFMDDVDDFPNDTTQWQDNDGDGFGDNQNGNNPDLFFNDPNEWSDTDADGFGDNSDLFPNDPTQWIDSDGDGCGDNLTGNNFDLFPNDSSECNDSDNDGVGDNSDLCPGFNDSIDVDLDNVSDGCDDFIDADFDGIIDSDDECNITPTGIKTQPDGCNTLVQLFRQNSSDQNNKFSFGEIILLCLLILSVVTLIKMSGNYPFFGDKIQAKDLVEISPSPKIDLPTHWSVDGVDYRQFSDGTIQIRNQTTDIWEQES